MQLHQILTGSCNINDQCLTLCNCEQTNFIVYGSGRDIVILNDELVRHQIISGGQYNVSQVTSISCTIKTGYILAIYSNIVLIFHPKINKSPDSKIHNIEWEQVSKISCQNFISDAAWMPTDSKCLFLVGKNIEVWQSKEICETLNSVKSEISWTCTITRNSPDNSIIDTLQFSPDGKYCATSCKNSFSICIWFWKNMKKNVEKSTDYVLDYTMIKHPSRIIYFEWRMISHHMPNQLIKNIILTCSEDNVCRIWSENHLHNHNSNSDISETSTVSSESNNITLESEIISKCQNDLSIKPNTQNKSFPTLDYFPNFILSASINDNSDIPSFVSHMPMRKMKEKKQFIVHWMNNKSFIFESIVNELMRRVKLIQTSDEEDSDFNADIFARKFMNEIIKWKKSTDVLFSIHPLNGNLMIWHAFSLDDVGDMHLERIQNCLYLKNSQITVHSCLPNNVPLADATSMKPKILLLELKENLPVESLESDNELLKEDVFIANMEIKMISKQDNGSLNMWNMSLANDTTGNSSIISMKHLYRISGHRWQTNAAACHSQLPLLLTISNFSGPEDFLDKSELILWRIKSVGPFSKSGGISEIARINSKTSFNFIKITWFPGSIPSNLIEADLNSPIGLFIASNSKNIISLYMSIPEANNLLIDEFITTQNNPDRYDFKIISLSSSGEPGCIIYAGFLESSEDIEDNKKSETIFLHIFPKDMILENFQTLECQTKSISDTKNYNESYFIVRILKVSFGRNVQFIMEMWQINLQNVKVQVFGKRCLNDLIKLKIDSKKILSKPLKFDSNVQIIEAVAAASHLSSASIYPECLAPYLIATLCSDNSIKFWKCILLDGDELNFDWIEWSMKSKNLISSQITTVNRCFKVSCAYSGRVAIAFLTEEHTVCVKIYECESTGGSEWLLEDTIQFTNYQDAIKSYSADSNGILNYSNLMHIDWINSEDGCHFLSISLGTNINIFAPTCSQVMKYNQNSLNNQSFAKWMKIREVNLRTTTYYPYIAHISWAREGLLIIGVDNEIHVYNQWNPHFSSFKSQISLMGKDCNENKYFNISKTMDSSTCNFSYARLEEAYKKNKQLKKAFSKASLNSDSDQQSMDEQSFILKNSGLFEISQIFNSILPQYHPKKLLEWINFGKIHRVKAILSHLTDCICGHENNQSTIGDSTAIYNQDKNRLEIKAIPPLPLYILLEMDNGCKRKRLSESENFEDDVENDVVFELDFKDEIDTSEKNEFKKETRTDSSSWFSLANVSIFSDFTPDKARKLSDCLLRLQLPGISALDQIYLLGIAEIICNIKTDLQLLDKGLKPKISDSRDNEKKLNATNSLDECGLKFLFAMQHYSYMTRTLPINQRNILLNEGLELSSIIWGFHSETEDELASKLDEITANNIMWTDFKRYGCGWWIRNDFLLQRTIEKIAKNTFQKVKEPMDVAIYYLAMGKQNLVAKLFKNCNKKSLADFFSLEFTNDENKKRALNQAYKLRSKRKYDHAAALFLLCNAIDDALLIILHNLKDVQLAITISRLYDNSVHVSHDKRYFHEILRKYVVESQDPFIRSIGYWMIEDYSNSLDTLIDESSSSKPENLKNSPSVETIVFIFYNYLKKHPIVKRHKNANTNLLNYTKSNKEKEQISPMERRLFYRTSYKYVKMGCPDLALEVLSTLPERIFSENNNGATNNNKIIGKTNNNISNDIMEWSEFEDNLMEPSMPTFEIEWNEKPSEILTNGDVINTSSNDIQGELDIMCLQYKFMICLKLITEELCTLATGIESSGSYLRCYFYNWLENEFNVLHGMCRHNSRNNSKIDILNLISKEHLHIRLNWLKVNKSLILSLYSYCASSSPNNVGLGAIKTELMILLQELQTNTQITEKSISLPIELNLPLINCSFYQDNGIIITPIQQIRENISDIMDIICSFDCPFLYLFIHSHWCSTTHERKPEVELSKIQIIISLCQTLSASVFQCLSVLDYNEKSKDSFPTASRTRKSSSSVLYTAEADIQVRSKISTDKCAETVLPNTDPSKWPGFTSLATALKFKGKYFHSNYTHLLAETLVVVYLGMVLYAFKLNDANILYRLVNVNFDKNLWYKVFGGTFRKKPSRPGPPEKYSPSVPRVAEINPIIPKKVSMSRINTPPPKPQPPIIDEVFIPPAQSILSCLLEKPNLSAPSDLEYDSDNEECLNTGQYNSDDFDELFDFECKTSNSFTWSLLKLVILNSASVNITNLLRIIQLEPGEIAMYCPNILLSIKFISQMETMLKKHLFNVKSVPFAYKTIIDSLDVKNMNVLKNVTNESKLVELCKLLCEIPFEDSEFSSHSIKRLWIYLMNQPSFQPIFLQHFIHLTEIQNITDNITESTEETMITSRNKSNSQSFKSIKIVHKEHEVIHSLSINPNNTSLLATSTSKEIIELNIDNLVNPQKWKQDDFEYLNNLLRDGSKSKAEVSLGNDFLLVTPTFGLYNYVDKSTVTNGSQMVLKRPVSGVQILRAHPKYPYYLSGNNNGQVSVFEWNIENPIVKTYSPIQKGKVTSLNFDSSGNKFGMGDSEGLLSLCHFSYADNSRSQYFQAHCPHKGVADLCFLNSSSLIATCGGSGVSGISTVNHLHAVGGGLSTFDSNSVNIVVWDVLLPNGRNQVKKFSDPQIAVGVVSMCYSSKYEQIIFGTRKGEIGLVDLRKNLVTNIIQAHDHSITSIKLDSLQSFFVTSSGDGYIKIWKLDSFEMIEYFKNEQIKTSVFRQTDVGIKSLQLLDDDKILSCGGDGLIRLRYLDMMTLFKKNNNSDIL